MRHRVLTDLGPTQAIERDAHVPLGARVKESQGLSLLDPATECLELPGGWKIGRLTRVRSLGSFGQVEEHVGLARMVDCE